MNGLNSGETTLSDVKTAIEDSKSNLEAAWQGDYLHYGDLAVPASFTEVDQKIKHSHALREAAYNEYLAYWKDQDVNHIESAQKTFVRSEQIAQAVIPELNAKMKQLIARK